MLLLIWLSPNSPINFVHQPLLCTRKFHYRQGYVFFLKTFPTRLSDMFLQNYGLWLYDVCVCVPLSHSATQKGRFTAHIATSPDWLRGLSTVPAEENPSSVLWTQLLLFAHCQQTNTGLTQTDTPPCPLSLTPIILHHKQSCCLEAERLTY